MAVTCKEFYHLSPSDVEIFAVGTHDGKRYGPEFLDRVVERFAELRGAHTLSCGSKKRGDVNLQNGKPRSGVITANKFVEDNVLPVSLDRLYLARLTEASYIVVIDLDKPVQ